MKQILLIILSIVTLCNTIVEAQLVNSRKRADSLKMRHENIHDLNEKDKASLYFALALTYGKLNLDTAFVYADEGIAYARQSKNEFLSGRMYLAKASLYNYRGQFEQAVKTYNLAIKTCLQAKDSIAAASALNDKGTCLQELKKYEAAKQAYKEAGQAFLDLDYEHMAGNTHSARALLQYQTGDYVEAVKSANKAIQIFQKHNYPGFMSSPLNVLGNIAMKKKDYSTAMDYYHKSQEIEQKENGYEELIVLQVKFGEIASLHKEYSKAENTFKKGIELCNQHGSSQFKPKLLLALAKTKRLQGHTKEAEDYLLRAENIMLKDGHENDLADLYLEYSSYHHSLGNNQIAIDFAKRSIEQAKKVPFYNYSETYQELESLYNKEGMNFKNDFPDAKTYIDSINQHMAILESIPFGINVTDTNQPVSTAHIEAGKESSYLVYIFSGLILCGVFLLLFVTLYRKKSKKRTKPQIPNTELKNSTERFVALQISPVINRRPTLSTHLSSFDKAVNQEILLKNHLYRDVKLSQASAISELTNGQYSVRQIRDNFKLINYESFNDYKYKLRVVDYLNELIESTIKPELSNPDSNKFGLDSDRQLSTVFNAMTGIKLSTYKKLIKHTSEVINTNSEEFATIKQNFTKLELHSNIIRHQVVMQLKMKPSESIEKQFVTINQNIAAYKMDTKAIAHLKELNKKGVDANNLLELYMSALYFWISEKEKYSFEFIQNLSSLFWGVKLEKETFDIYKTKWSLTENSDHINQPVTA